MAHFRQIVSFDEMTKMRMIFDRKIKQLHAPSLSSLLSSQISFRLKCKINQLMAVVVVVSVVTFCSHNPSSNCSCCHLQFWNCQLKFMALSATIMVQTARGYKHYRLQVRNGTVRYLLTIVHVSYLKCHLSGQSKFYSNGPKFKCRY